MILFVPPICFLVYSVLHVVGGQFSLFVVVQLEEIRTSYDQSAYLNCANLSKFIQVQQGFRLCKIE